MKEQLHAAIPWIIIGLVLVVLIGAIVRLAG